MADFKDGLVVRNTFLDFPETEGDSGYPVERRRRAASDLTDTKLPWKVPLNNTGGGEAMYTITRRRLGSEHEPISPPAGGDPALNTVEEQEEDEEQSPPSNTRRRNRTRSRIDTADPFSAPAPLPMGFPGQPPLPPGGMPMPMSGYPLPPWGYPVPGGSPGGMPVPPWPLGPHAPGGHPGAPHFPAWGFPGAPFPPGAAPPQAGAPQRMPPANQGRDGKKNKGAAQQGQQQPPMAAEKGRGGRQQQQQQQMQQGRGVQQEGPSRNANAGKNLVAAPEPTTAEPTTVMLRNIPNRYNSGTLIGLLDEHGFQGLYDFVYLPMDFQNGVNLGYAFVNLPNHQDAMRFKKVFHGFQDWRFDSQKVSEVSWAHPHQGLDEHVERYRNSPVMHPSMPDEYKPMIFRNGIRVPFPPPTRAIKAPKLRLSRDRPHDQGGQRNGEAPVPGPEMVSVCA